MKKTGWLLVGVAFFISLPQAALSESVTGLFISHKLNDDKAYKQWRSDSQSTFHAHDCEPIRSGKLLGGKGSFKWGDSDKFTLMKCQSPVLADLVDKGLVDELSAITDELNLTEGKLNILSDTLPSENAEYLIKIGRAHV